MTKWTARDIPAQAGRTIVVTGANSGLGLVTTRELARAGARVVLAVRDIGRGEAAAREIRDAAGEVDIDVRRLDLADQESIQMFADAWDGPLDVLINNAGIMAVPQGTTKDGFESQVGTNHLGHFALTNRLLPQITDRVVTLSSGAHRMGRILVEDLNWERRRYHSWRAYGQSKLANLLFTLELQRRLQASGSTVRALASHPGYASTNLQSHTGNIIQNTVMAAANKVVAQSDAMGALPTMFAATQDLPGGSYVGPDGPAESRGYPTLVGRSRAASDPDMAKELWDLSEKLTSVSYRL